MHTYERNPEKTNKADEMRFISGYKSKNLISPNKKDVQNTKTSCKKRAYKMIAAFLSMFLWILNFRKTPKKNKYAAHSTLHVDNHGSAAVEAACIMPILLFAFLAFYFMGQIYIMDNQIYQASLDTARYLAEYAYFTEYMDVQEDEENLTVQTSLGDSIGTNLLGIGLANAKFQSYLGVNQRVQQYVTAGNQGICLISGDLLDAEGFINFQVIYRIHIPVPLLNDLSITLRHQIHQKAYTGYVPSEDEVDENNIYVYITEYGSVYHMTRTCSHLQLTIQAVTEDVLNRNYSYLEPCEYCGDKASDVYYVTEYGERYHTSAQCTGLKRTIERVPLSQVSGLAPCATCGN